MNAKQSKATTSNNKRYSLLIALFCLCVMAYGQMFRESKPTIILDETTTSTEWPEGMVWQNLAIDDNGVKRYWHYNGEGQLITLQENKGNTPADEWAILMDPYVADRNRPYYLIYNRAAGPTHVLCSHRLPQATNITNTTTAASPRMLSYKDVYEYTIPLLLQQNVMYKLLRNGTEGFFANYEGYQDPDNPHYEYLKPLRLAAKNDGNAYYLHIETIDATTRTNIISEKLDSEIYRDSIFTALEKVMPIISQAVTQTTQSKDGVIGSWKPEARTELKRLHTLYNTSKTDVEKAKALLDYYLQAIKDGGYLTIQSGRVYRIVNAWDELGSYSLTLDPTTDKFTMAPTDPNNLLQHFIFLKHIDGHYIGSPYTGKFMAMPPHPFIGEGFEMRSLNTHVDFGRRAYGGYDRIGSLKPYDKDGTIQQIKIFTNDLFPTEIGFLSASRTNNLGGIPTGFRGTFNQIYYSPENYPHAGWYIYPVDNVLISEQGFTDLVRGANITAAAGRLFGPTTSATTAITAAYKDAIATLPPKPSALAKLHTEVSMQKIKAMPWIMPRPNIAFRLLNWGADKDFSPMIITGSDKVEYPMNYDLQVSGLYNEMYSYNSFVFVPHESQPNKYKLWQAQRDRYLVINSKGYPGLSEDKATPPVALTLKPHYEDSTQLGFTMQIEDGRYLSIVFEKRDNGSYGILETYFLKFTPELKNEPTFSSVWSCDTSIIDVAYIDDLGYTTFSSSRAATLPNELTAHKVTAFEQTTNTLAVKPVTESIIPANTGVLLKGTSGPYWLEDTIASGNVAAYADNLLKPNVAPTLLPGPVYMLSGTSPADVGFYRSRTNILFPAKRAYLPQSVIFTGAPALRLVEADIISNISTVHDTNTAKPQVYYDLQGRRVEKPTKGIYIVNGQKVAF